MTHVNLALLAERATIDDVVEWDIRNWERALTFWESRVPGESSSLALTLGERHGGLSLWCALKGMTAIATDLHGLTERGLACHVRYGVTSAIRYGHVDATSLPFADSSFDIVLFKSVLGALATKPRQANATKEMHRVLKPGGMLLFAENLTGSTLHRKARERFVPWSKRWRYLHPVHDLNLFDCFESVELEYRGVIGLFGRTPRQRNVLAGIDRLLNPVLPNSVKYILFGIATKHDDQ